VVKNKYKILLQSSADITIWFLFNNWMSFNGNFCLKEICSFDFSSFDFALFDWDVLLSIFQIYVYFIILHFINNHLWHFYIWLQRFFHFWKVTVTVPSQTWPSETVNDRFVPNHSKRSMSIMNGFERFRTKRWR